jgi:hypothetical protein
MDLFLPGSGRTTIQGQLIPRGVALWYHQPSNLTHISKANNASPKLF